MSKKQHKEVIKELKNYTSEDMFLVNLENIIAKGYYPSNLPPSFTSGNFAEYLCNNYEYVMDLIEKLNDVNTKFTKYYLARPRQIRRVLGVINPINIAILGSIFARHQDTLLKKSKSDVSLSSPIIDTSDNVNARALRQEYDWNVGDEFKIKNRAGKKVLVYTDISRFYPSIYTHSIPWVLEGKEFSKKHRTEHTLGNLLDKAFQWGQDGQTCGIPIGTDISFVIAELICTEIDVQMKSKFPDIKCLRRVDDIEFTCDSRDEARKILSYFHSLLGKFELEVNNSKTEIKDLPQPILSQEILKISCSIPDSGADIKKIMNFFDVCFEAYNTNQKGSLKYAIKSINNEALQGKYADLYINFICNCIVIESGCIESALIKLSPLIKNGSLTKEAKEVMIESFINIIKYHSVQKHTNEVLWALWGVLLLEEKVNAKIENLIIDMGDPFVILVAIDLAEKGLFSINKIKKYLDQIFDEDILKEENWILAYEATRLKVTPKKYRDLIKGNAFFSELLNNNVSFYELKSIDEYHDIFEDWLDDNYGCIFEENMEGLIKD